MRFQVNVVGQKSRAVFATRLDGIVLPRLRARDSILRHFAERLRTSALRRSEARETRVHRPRQSGRLRTNA